MIFSLWRNVSTFCKRLKKLTFQLFTTIFSFYSSDTIRRLYRFCYDFFTSLDNHSWPLRHIHYISSFQTNVRMIASRFSIFSFQPNLPFAFFFFWSESADRESIASVIFSSPPLQIIDLWRRPSRVGESFCYNIFLI